MKKLCLLVTIICLIILVVGCGGGGNAKVSYIAVKSVAGDGSVTNSLTAQRIVPGPVSDPDGANGKFNASTEFYCAQTAGNCHRTLCLQVYFYDDQGNQIDVPYNAPVNWTHDFDASEVWIESNIIMQVSTDAIGVHNVTAEYQGIISENKVVVVKRFFTGDQRYCGCKLKLSDYNENSTSPDITSSFNTTTKVYTLNAPNGIAVLETTNSVYLDRDPRNRFCEIDTIPAGLSWQTSLTIPEDKSVICFARDAAGGTAKILFGQGLNFFYRCLDTYIEYIGPGQTDFQLHY